MAMDKPDLLQIAEETAATVAHCRNLARVKLSAYLQLERAVNFETPDRRWFDIRHHNICVFIALTSLQIHITPIRSVRVQLIRH